MLRAGRPVFTYLFYKVMRFTGAPFFNLTWRWTGCPVGQILHGNRQPIFQESGSARALRPLGSWHSKEWRAWGCAARQIHRSRPLWRNSPPSNFGIEWRENHWSVAKTDHRWTDGQAISAMLPRETAEVPGGWSFYCWRYSIMSEMGNKIAFWNVLSSRDVCRW